MCGALLSLGEKGISMRLMEKNALVSELTSFLTTEPACIKSLECLSEKAQIGIQIADHVQLCVHYKENQVLVEEKEVNSADFIFSAQPTAIEVLLAEKGLNPGQLGVKLTKQIINRDIHVSMPGNLFQVTQKGYLNILKVGGVDFLNELKKHNLASIPKIMSALRNLRKS